MTNDTTVRIPQQARSIDKRNRLVDAAMDLFGQKGFQGTTAREIANAAGVSVGTFYAYFTDKKAMLIEIFTQHMANVDHSVFTELKSLSAGKTTGRELMRCVVELGHISHKQSPELLRVLLAMRYTDEDFAQLSERQDNELVAKLTRFLETLRSHLRVDDLEAAARIVSNAFEETMHSVAVTGQAIGRERLYDALVDMTAVYLFQNPDAPL
ncbi:MULTISPECIES: TetR/AcrR family transcriptional regulator [unclassified Pseudodesulfovibrio]|uniref:TetR/AcrR family transcriptional regulator n=1 Tax=unclassified Pseudodesulfovibrio TaxID=2661612 RepID=UPI000FEB7815|nr:MULTISPECIES: TetR/AcrR family transcriptional regulator [unclassified Pseudodesulfovibrio]MCJ2164939.1 TetR/AcrR family transcriptional regulator [Pseudodesulfovibrio sp. S3-i]RWU03698.1 TetR/AcrR family transcriptional regulator [Pseudodesulfovibrio sp. S3]